MARIDIAPWIGEIEFKDPMTIDLVLGWEKAIASIQNLTTQSEVDAALLPAILACVKSTDIEGLAGRLSVESFPATPRKQSAQLIAWMVRQISGIYAGEQVPNA